MALGPDPHSDLFSRRPWFGSLPAVPGDPVGMLGRRESELFCELARSWWRGQGTIVDAGSFLGKSAFHLARGLQQNPAHVAATDRIHCFDNFLVNEGATVAFLSREFGMHRALHASTRDIFESQVAPVAHLLEVHAGDFHSIAWHRQPVEILMVDVAKSPSLMGRVVELFFADLIPGRSLVIHQDYHHAWLPHIHVVMSHLRACFELVAPKVDDSAVFLCTQPISGELLERARRFDFTPEEQEDLLDLAIVAMPDDARLDLELAQVVLGSQWRTQDALQRELATIARRIAGGTQPGFDLRRLHAAEEHVTAALGRRCLDAGDANAALGHAQALPLTGERAPFHLHLLGAALSRLGRWDEAEAALRRSLALPVRCSEAREELIRLLITRGRLDEAEQHCFDALADRDATRLPLRCFHELLGAALERRNSPEHALGTIARCCSAFADEPETWIFAARVNRALLQTEGARSCLRRALANGAARDRVTAVAAELGLPFRD